MFSSLEALDAEDNLHATPVTRQGAFQPKAKPRARKGGAGPPRPPLSAPASKTKSLLPSASNADDLCERKQNDGAKLREDAETAVERNLETQSVGIAPEVSNKVGIETGPTHNSGLTGASLIYSTDLTAGPERNLSIDFDAAIECQAALALHEPIALAEVSGISIVERQEGVALPSQVLSEQDAIGCLSTLSQEDGLETLTMLPGAPSAFDELLASHAFIPANRAVEHVIGIGVPSEQLADGMEDLPSSAVLETTGASRKKKRPRKDRHDGLETLTMLPDAPSAFDELLASHAFVPANPAVEHVIEFGVLSEQLADGMEDLPSSPVLETTGASRKKKRPRKDRHDDLLVVVDQGGLLLANDAPVVDRGMTSNSEAKPVKKKKKKKKGNHNGVNEQDQDGLVLAKDAPVVDKGATSNGEAKSVKKKKGNHNDGNEQQERVSVVATLNPQKKTKRPKVASSVASIPAVDATVAEETNQKELTARAAEPAKKKKRGCEQAQEGRDDGKDRPRTISEASSKNNKKTSLAGSIFASAPQSVAEIAIEVSGAKESTLEAVQTAAMKQDVEEQQDSGASKRKRRKPARFLDGADDDEVNVTCARIKGASDSINRQQNFAENDLLSELFPSLPKKISKLKESKLASFNATADATTSQPPIETGRKANWRGKPVTPTTEENQKKKFKKFVPQRRRVERRAMNPANPDLDPKKMTMKDIIRLAEAKERMLKKDNANKAKNGNQVTVNEPEREPESYESTCMAPQVQIVDGQIVINEQSLHINAHPKDDIRTYKRVEETHAKLNYHSYMKRTRTQTWRPDETELFYQALREFGTNFAMIQHLFPGRTRKQVLLKYKKEERCSPLRISEAMRVKPCDTSHFLEVISSLNLLPSEIPGELESEQASVPVELSSSKKEIDDNSCCPGGGERRMADGAGCALKLDEPSVHSMNQETDNKSSSSPCNIETFNSGQPDSNQELVTEEATELNEIPKPCESPRKAPSPPRKKKSLFSYQTAAAKS